jgi:hypothetical protein
MELLALNQVKVLQPLCDFALKTPRLLCNVPDEDIIELFI